MIRFGLLGCGAIASRHASLLAGGFIPGATLGAVCDVDAARAATLAEKHRVPRFDSIDGMIRSESVNAITVLTPSGSHANDVVALAKYKLPIVVEKPMALTLDDADRMIESCDRHGARLFVVKQNRFNKPVSALKAALDRGRFGKLVLGTVRVRWCRTEDYYRSASWRGTWAEDGGVLANQASHHIDLLEWLMGDVDAVVGMASRALAPIEAEDTAVAILRFRSGALGVIEATTATRPKDLEGSISVLGEAASVEIGGFAASELKIWNFQKREDTDATVFAEHGRNPDHPFGYAHSEYYRHVVDCIEQGKHQLIDGLEGRRSLELIIAVYESIETGREIQLRLRPRLCRLGRG